MNETRRRACARLSWALAIVSLLALPARAGTLCGTVRDAQTQAPIFQAGIFLYDDQGAFTGLATSSASDGTWCLDDVAAGTYTVQVKRDDYLVAQVDGVEVQDDPTSVDIAASTVVALRSPWPNPAQGGVSLRFRAPAGTPLALDVVDLAGRRVRGWRGVGHGTDTSLQWDFRDGAGRLVATGTYFVTLRAGDVVVSRPLLHLR